MTQAQTSSPKNAVSHLSSWSCTKSVVLAARSESVSLSADVTAGSSASIACAVAFATATASCSSAVTFSSAGVTQARSEGASTREVPSHSRNCADKVVEEEPASSLRMAAPRHAPSELLRPVSRWNKAFTRRLHCASALLLLPPPPLLLLLLLLLLFAVDRASCFLLPRSLGLFIVVHKVLLPMHTHAVVGVGVAHDG